MDPRRTFPASPATVCACQGAAAPTISAPEREFWRRAVEAERARLALRPPPDTLPPASGVN